MSFARIKAFWRKKHLVLTKGQATSTRLSLKAHQLPSTNLDAEAEHYIENILRIYAGVSQLTDLRPSSITDTLFSELVGLCVTVIPRTISDLVRNIGIPKSEPNVLQDPRISAILPDLRRICAAAEAELESHWAEAISSSTTSKEAHRVLQTFPYHNNYEKLTHLELSAISSTGISLSSVSKIAFIGSGPMPLTSFYLLSELNSINLEDPHQAKPINTPTPPSTPGNQTPENLPLVSITNIDINARANQQAQGLCTSLGGHLVTGMKFVDAEAGSNDVDLTEFDVVWLAALVGAGQKEKEVVGKMKKGSLLVMRGAWGLRGVLYCDFDASSSAVTACLDICVRMDPFGEVVNSVIVGRVK
ncbi:nicotianamine synthase protein [Rutstroemia sp. NJR-2017a BBW]|nr:nicotianamine synthase protein [Rutstroemia sp. NJR-2017a BBW]